MNQAHDLHSEFPEYHDEIHALKLDNAHFNKLHDEYNELVHELKRIEQEIETPEDNYVESLKVKRLAVKDEIFTMLKGKKEAKTA